MIDEQSVVWFSRNVAEMLMILAAVGALTGLLRWRNAQRKDFITAFIIFLTFTALRELPVFLGGMSAWSVELIALSGACRVGQIVGAVLFTRAALRDKCPPWAWVTVVLAAAACAWLL